MAFTDHSLHKVRSKSETLEICIFSGETNTSNYSRNKTTGMGFQPDSTRLKKSTTFNTQVISTATSWARKISISEGYHEFLDECYKSKHAHLQFGPKTTSCLHSVDDDFDCPILPGLPDDIAKYCLALVPRTYFSTMGIVSRRWRSFIKSKEFIIVRRLSGLVEEWISVLSMDTEGDGTQWEVLDCFGNKQAVLPQMPGPEIAGFGVVVVNGKLIVMAGYSMVAGVGSVSSDVYQYDSCLNSWSKISNMNVPRYDFACAEVNGMVYAVGGYGVDGDSLSCAEVYDPETNKWTLIESLRHPRWGCFACGLEGKLYVMGGRSSFTIGNSRFVDVYNLKEQSWCEMKNGCVMVTAHAVVGKKLFCVEWKNQRKLAIFNPEDGSWKMVGVPVTGSSRVGFRFGIIEDKLLLFSLEEERGANTLMYDPNATTGSEWQTSKIKPSGLCLCCVTIKA